MQVPVPLQREAAVSVPPVQAGSLQITPAPYLRQAPAPSQVPSLPQLVMPWSSHSFRGSNPASAGRQIPTPPCKAHELQGPEQSVAQHTPSKQKPLRQSSGAEQDCPLGSPGRRGPPPESETAVSRLTGVSVWEPSGEVRW
jgi:hypothetical protein